MTTKIQQTKIGLSGVKAVLREKFIPVNIYIKKDKDLISIT